MIFVIIFYYIGLYLVVKTATRDPAVQIANVDSDLKALVGRDSVDFRSETRIPRNPPRWSLRRIDSRYD